METWPNQDAETLCRSLNALRTHYTVGQLVPIVVRDGEVIDGRKRLKACGILGVKPKEIERRGLVRMPRHCRAP